MTVEDVQVSVETSTTSVSFHGLTPAPGPVRFRCPATTDARPLRVLAVGINFGPEHTGIAPYTTQLCEHLVDSGAEVTVLTGVPHYPGWKVEPEDRWRLRRTERRGKLVVRRLRHFVPRSQSAARRGLYELTFALQVALHRPRTRPDVVLAVVPSLLSAVVAQRIAKKAGVPLVVWVQDLMGAAAAQSGIEGGSKVARLVGDIERWVLKRADKVVVITSRFQDYTNSIGISPDATTVLPNWTHMSAPTQADRAEVRARMGWRPDETIVLHSGNMGLKQDLGNVIAAARLADECATNSVRFVLMGDGSQRESLQAEAEGVACLTFAPPVDQADLADTLAAADILLINERPSAADMSLPSKLTCYFRAGRPVIAASPADGGTATEIARSAAGVVVEPGDPAILLAATLDLTNRPETAHEMGVLGAAHSEHHLSRKSALATFQSHLCTPVLVRT